MANIQFRAKVKIARNDNGVEFTSKPMRRFYKDNETIHKQAA